jgi:methylmalonyl-CoA/ethylmalonyl-CoA epimerase
MTTPDKSACNARHINHVAIAVSDIDESLALYRRIFSLPETEVEELEDQGVRAALVTVGGSQLEFIAPTDPEGGVARFIAKRGEGLHHVCFEVDGLQGTLDALDKEGVGLIDREPREGLSGMIGFLHPKSTGGVLVELVDSETARH